MSLPGRSPPFTAGFLPSHPLRGAQFVPLGLAQLIHLQVLTRNSITSVLLYY